MNNIFIYLTMLYKKRCDHVGSATYPLILHIINYEHCTHALLHSGRYIHIIIVILIKSEQYLRII